MGPCGGGWYRFTGRAEGDFAPASCGVEQRRSALAPGRWTWLRQVHGADVVVVEAPGAGAGTVADAAVTAVPGAVLAVTVADCAPVALLAEGAVGVVHAGWRGLAAGVVGAALEAMRRLGAGSSLRAVVGPCIRAHCYEFGAGDLDGLERALGPGVRATTVAGRPALDLVEAVRLALASGGVDAWADEGRCTACSPAYWSHRAGGDPQRQALIAGLAP